MLGRGTITFSKPRRLLSKHHYLVTTVELRGWLEAHLSSLCLQAAQPTIVRPATSPPTNLDFDSLSTSHPDRHAIRAAKSPQSSCLALRLSLSFSTATSLRTLRSVTTSSRILPTHHSCSNRSGAPHHKAVLPHSNLGEDARATRISTNLQRRGGVLHLVPPSRSCPLMVRGSRSLQRSVPSTPASWLPGYPMQVLSLRRHARHTKGS